ncbi:MAG: hypothetical protein J6A20_10955 [Muribaculaceae bacterium]|nr:hypothetical protein [Muribaculaceae bacterium]
MAVAGSLAGCGGRDTEVTPMLDRAEAVMDAHPDSALLLLKRIDKSVLASKTEKARYALLISMAFDKNYIDTTSFDVLQPAIDYYLEKGSPDEKLRTYYYQGRIFQNKGDRENALNSFVKGIDIAPKCTDSLAVARALVAQAYLYHEFYEIDSYIDNHLRAAAIYKALSNKDYEFSSLLNALNGTILLNDKNRADSLLRLCESFELLNNYQNQSLLRSGLSYAIKFGSKHEIKNQIDRNSEFIGSDVVDNPKLALAYNKIGDNYRAKELLDAIKESGMGYDTLKYLSVLVPVLKDLGHYEDALSMYEEFNRRSDSIDILKFNQKIQLIDEKHAIELKAQNDARVKTQIIWSCICGIILLVMVILILLLFVRSSKAQKGLAIQKSKIIELENENLKSERENLALENKNLQLERDKKALEAENLIHRVESLENESDNLKHIIETHDASEELPVEVRKAIQIRIEMLNSLLASHITDNEQYGKSYNAWVKELTDNTEEFMDSNRLAFQASHPRFIQYFEKYGLSVSEINYVCLYAIGLRGKEVGNYMKKRSHVNISSAIRKKLGIDKHETNIGIYVRKLLKNI